MRPALPLQPPRRHGSFHLTSTWLKMSSKSGGGKESNKDEFRNSSQRSLDPNRTLRACCGASPRRFPVYLSGWRCAACFWGHLPRRTSVVAGGCVRPRTPRWRYRPLPACVWGRWWDSGVKLLSETLKDPEQSALNGDTTTR